VNDTPPDDVWDACTNPERIPRWFLPISGDVGAGGGDDNGTADPFTERAVSLRVMSATGQGDARSSCRATR
jgi:uncharacterized protein YndB with AHSA1/START domain